MYLYRMITEYIFPYTIPVMSVFSVCALLHLGLQIYTPSRMMFYSISRRTITERLLVILMPVAFILFFAFIDLFDFGSFLSGGFREEKLPELEIFMLSDSVMQEVRWVLFLFPLTFLLIKIVLRRVSVKKNIITVLLNIVETVINFAFFLFCLCCTVCMAKHGTFPNINMFPKNTLCVWYVYSVYSLVIQIVFNLVALFLHVFFSKAVLKDDLLHLASDSAWCRRQVIFFFQDGYKMIFSICIPFLILFSVMMAEAAREEGIFSFAFNFFLIFLLPLWTLFFYCLFFILFPSRISSVRRMQTWGNTEKIYRLFCLEFLDDENPPRKGFLVSLTDNFILTPKAPFHKLYYIHDFENIEKNRRGKFIRFRDGSRISLQKNYTEADTRLLHQAVSGHGVNSNTNPFQMSGEKISDG